MDLAKMCNRIARMKTIAIPRLPLGVTTWYPLGKHVQCRNEVRMGDRPSHWRKRNVVKE